MVLLDGNNLAYIAYYSLGELSDGEIRTGTVFGFLNIVNRIAGRFGPKLVFCFDSKTNLRKKADKTYKANRHKDMTTDEATELNHMHKQITQLRREVLPALGFKNARVKRGYEGDDVIAYYAKKYSDEKKIIIVSTDKDLYQLLTDNTCIYNPKTHKEYTKSDFITQYNVKPSQWPMIKAIAGDTSDNIKGVPMVGEKTAIKYVKGLLSTTTKAYENIKLSKAIIKDNLEMVTLPYKDIDFGFKYKENKLTRLGFIKVFDRLKFIYYLRDEQFKKWENNFELE